MLKVNQKGVINPLVIPLVLSVIAVIGLGVMSFIYYGNYIDQRDNVDKKVASAVEEAEFNQKKKLEAEFIQREKIPNDSYTTPSIYGSVKLTYPKTWSSFVTDSGSTLDYYAHPAYVPAKGVNYALRMNIASKDFASEVKSLEQKVKRGDLKAVSITVAGVTGTRLDGILKKDQVGTIVLFPLRDKTLRIWTENPDYAADFENVLKLLSFSP